MAKSIRIIMPPCGLPGSALHRHLLPNSTVVRTKLGAYALIGTQPPYMSKRNAIIAALKKGWMMI